MNIKPMASGGLVSLMLAACAAPITPVPEVGATIPVKGQCGEFTCEQLFQTIETRWPQQMAELETECPDVDSYGLNVWENEEQKFVSLLCWRSPEVFEDSDSPATIYGSYYRTFPYPGFEETFLADNNCRDDAACLTLWQKLEAKYPEEIYAARQTCAFRQGFMLYNIDGAEMVNIACGFFVPSIQIDEDGDGVSDGESKPTGVDIPLGSFPLESLDDI